MFIEDNVIKMPDLNIEINSHGIGCEIFDCMKRNEDLLAQVFQIIFLVVRVD